MNLTHPATDRQPPPLGDLATRELVRLLVEWWRTGDRPLRFRARSAALDDIRAELRRRSALGVGPPR